MSDVNQSKLRGDTQAGRALGAASSLATPVGVYTRHGWPDEGPQPAPAAQRAGRSAHA